MVNICNVGLLYMNVNAILTIQCTQFQNGYFLFEYTRDKVQSVNSPCTIRETL